MEEYDKINISARDEDSDVFEKCVQRIKKLEPIDQDQEKGLILEAKQGNQRAFEQLVLANLSLILSIAQQYRGQGITLKLIIDQGTLGIMKSIQKFDENDNIEFSSYVVRRIDQSILQFFEENDIVTRFLGGDISQQLLDEMFKNIGEKYNKNPTIADIVEILKYHTIPSQDR